MNEFKRTEDSAGTAPAAAHPMAHAGNMKISNERLPRILYLNEKMKQILRIESASEDRKVEIFASVAEIFPGETLGQFLKVLDRVEVSDNTEVFSSRVRCADKSTRMISGLVQYIPDEDRFDCFFFDNTRKLKEEHLQKLDQIIRLMDA